MIKKARMVLVAIGLGVLAPALAAAQVENNLSSYTGTNGVGYMDPLKDALGSALSDGLFSSGHVARMGPRIQLSIQGMIVGFDEDERTFSAQAESYFTPDDPNQTEFTAPTIIGDTSSVTIPGEAGTHFTFPGGFNLDNFALAVPQLNIGNIAGTEAIVRWVAFDTGDAEIGDISLFGIGARHSISQYFGPTVPVDVSAMFFWQSFKIGDDDLVDTKSLSYGLQASKRFTLLEPYVGLGMDSFDMDVEYQTSIGGTDQTIKLDFDKETNAHFTAGTALHLGFVHLHGQFNASAQTSWAFGLGLGM